MIRRMMLALLVTSCAAETPATSAPPKMPAPSHLPSVARALLQERMTAHGQDMSDLVWAMVFVDERSVVDIADNITRQPKLARPTLHDASELASRLPEEFFVMQDRLTDHATALGTAASEGDLDAMIEHYGEVMATCVGCHAAYLTDPSPHGDGLPVRATSR